MNEYKIIKLERLTCDPHKNRESSYAIVVTGHWHLILNFDQLSKGVHSESNKDLFVVAENLQEAITLLTEYLKKLDKE